MREMSYQVDPDHLVRLFSRHGNFLVPQDGFLTLTRRNLAEPHYRISRSWRWGEIINPWTESHLLPSYDRGLLGELLYAGRPGIIDCLYVPENDPAREHLEGMRTLAFAPSYEEGVPLTLVVLLRREPNPFRPEELEDLLLHTNLLGRSVNNLALAQQVKEAYQRLDEEMQQAGHLQRALLPATLPHVEGLDLGFSYVTSSQAGGDSYDVLSLPGGDCGLFLADVSGHGVAAAVGMAILHTLLRSCPEPFTDPGRVLGYLNRHLMAVAPAGMFASAFYGTYNPQSRHLRYALAGHPPPLLRRGPYPVRDLETTGGLPLGVVPDSTWSERELFLQADDALLVYTDGIVEGTNPAGEPFGRDRLADALALAPLRATRLVQHVERCFLDFCDKTQDLDDRTLLALVAIP